MSEPPLIIVTNDPDRIAREFFGMPADRLPRFIRLAADPDAIEALPAGTAVLAAFTFHNHRQMSPEEWVWRRRHGWGELTGDVEEAKDRIRDWHRRRAAYEQVLIADYRREHGEAETAAPAAAGDDGAATLEIKPRKTRWT